jgi:hypothetical protein
VTARLSQRFYDVLGEDVADELVDWFNAMFGFRIRMLIGIAGLLIALR